MLSFLLQCDRSRSISHTTENVLTLRVVQDGETTKGKKNPRRSPKARRERIKIEAISVLLDLLLDCAQNDGGRIFESRPVELRYFERRDDTLAVMCAVAPNNWVVRGWHVDVQQMDAYELVRELGKKKSAAVYRVKEIAKEGAVVKSIVTRTWVVFHSRLGYAIVAETSKRESLTP